MAEQLVLKGTLEGHVSFHPLFRDRVDSRSPATATATTTRATGND